MKFKRLKCKFCGHKLVMWKLIGISPLAYFPVCYPCAKGVNDKLNTFDLINAPIKKDVLSKAIIKKPQIQKPCIGYGN